MRDAKSAYCPTCEGYTKQCLPKRGSRYCWCCGDEFTLAVSRAAELADPARETVRKIINEARRKQLTALYGSSKRIPL